MAVFEDWSLEGLPWQPDPVARERFNCLYREVVTANRSLNLTRITEPGEFWEKHIWDSLWGVLPWLTQPPGSLRGLDLGTGAGFPGLPVAIALPAWELVLVDSTAKKVTFVEGLIAKLGLHQVRAHWDRAETLGHHSDHREGYDLVLVRAVGSAAVCAEYALPLLRPQGQAVLYRGEWTRAQTADLVPLVEGLGGTLIKVAEGSTPWSHSRRHCLYLQKTTPTPQQFPRRAGSQPPYKKKLDIQKETRGPQRRFGGLGPGRSSQGCPGDQG